MDHSKCLRSFLPLSLALAALFYGEGSTLLRAETPTDKTFILSSPAFTDLGTLPSEFTCDGKRASPPLAWSNAPAGTKFFALTMHHIPGPGDKHVYLVVYNIPAKVNSLPENSRDIGTWGINTVDGQQAYTPPCSKGPGPKLYTLTVYALSSAANLTKPVSSVTMDDLLAAIKDKTLATSAISVTYSRPGNAGQEAGGPGGGPPPPPGGGGPRIPRELEAALTNLNLIGDQKQKVDALLGDYQEKQRQLRDDLLKNLKSTLDADQYAKIEAAFHHPPPPPPDQAAQPPAKPGEQPAP